MSQEFYLPLHISNISEVFNKALIVPVKYLKSWQYDIQSNCKDSLILCKKPFTIHEKSSLLVVITEIECNKYLDKIDENFYFFNKPIPISRIKNVCFVDAKKAESTIYDIEVADSFIPKRLIKIINDNSDPTFSLVNKTFEHTDNWNDFITTYNQLLGGFALMRNANMSFEDYPKNYFFTLSKFNKEIAIAIMNFNFDKDYNDFINIVNAKIHSLINSPVKVETVKKYAKEKEKINISENYGVINIESIPHDSNSYILAILATYGNEHGKDKTIEDFISSLLKKVFPENRIEQLCLQFGINQGYSNFRNKYSYSGKKIDVKFRLDSKVDYYIIESIYQYIFNGTIENSNFEYLDNWMPEFKDTRDLKNFVTYKVLDKNVIYKKKAQVGSQEYFEELYQLFLENEVFKAIDKLFNESAKQGIKLVLNKLYSKISNDFSTNKVTNANFENEKKALEEKIKALQNENELFKEKHKTNEIIEVQTNDKKSNVQTVLGLEDSSNTKHNFINALGNIEHIKLFAKFYGIENYKNTDKDKLKLLIIEKLKE